MKQHYEINATLCTSDFNFAAFLPPAKSEFLSSICQGRRKGAQDYITSVRYSFNEAKWNQDENFGGFLAQIA